MRYGSSCPPLPTCLCSVVPACSTIVPHVALRCVATWLVSFWFEMVGEIFARREGCFFNNTLPPPKSSTVYYIPLCNGASVSTVQSSTGHVQWHTIYRVDSVLVVGGIVYQRIDKYQLFLALHPFFFFRGPPRIQHYSNADTFVLLSFPSLHACSLLCPGLAHARAHANKYLWNTILFNCFCA